jgi:splicing factor 3B subunit 3
MFDM